MPRCADDSCARWRPDLSQLAWAGVVVRPWGALRFNESWYCSRSCVERAALRGLAQSAALTQPITARRPLRLGVLLQHAGAISQAQLDMALGASATTGLRIGRQLEQLGFVSADMVLRALATQAGISYLSTFDVSRVQRSPLALPEAMVRSLGLVPFEANADMKQAHVVCTAPLPRSAMRAFARLTGWTPEPYLVTDRAFEAALAAYRPAEDAEILHGATTVGTIGAAAAHVADTAVSDREVTMRHAAFDNRVWVRVEGMQRVSDLIVTSQALEDSCRVELTAH
jgi:type II secretion system (T2SS) protein E